LWTEAGKIFFKFDLPQIESLIVLGAGSYSTQTKTHKTSMTKSIVKSSLLGLLTLALAGLPLAGVAKDTTNAPATDKKPMKESGSQKSVPIHGKLKALDKAAKTITIGEHTLQITSETLISKFDKPATLEEGIVGEDVSATYKKSDDGKFTAVKVRFGPKAAKTAKADTKKEKKKE